MFLPDEGALSAARCPQATANDEDTADQVRWPDGFVQEECAEESTIERQGVVEDHGATGPKPADTGVPGQEADDGWDKSDVEDQSHKEGRGFHGQALQLPDGCQHEEGETQEGGERGGG